MAPCVSWIAMLVWNNLIILVAFWGWQGWNMYVCVNKLSKHYCVSTSIPPSFQYACLGLCEASQAEMCLYKILSSSIEYACDSICLFRCWMLGADLLKPKIYRREVHDKLPLVCAFMLMPFEWMPFFSIRTYLHYVDVCIFFLMWYIDFSYNVVKMHFITTFFLQSCLEGLVLEL